MSFEEHGEEDARVRRAGTRGQSWLLILQVLLTNSFSRQTVMQINVRPPH